VSVLILGLALAFVSTFTSLPQIYSILIINNLHLRGTKMSPQFE